MFRSRPRRFIYVSRRLLDEIETANPSRRVSLRKFDLPIIGGGIELDQANSDPRSMGRAIRRSSKVVRAKSLKRRPGSRFVRNKLSLRWGELEVFSPRRHVAWLSGFDSLSNPKVFVALCGSLGNFRDWDSGAGNQHEGWYPSSAHGMNEVLRAWEEDDPMQARKAIATENSDEWASTAVAIEENLGDSYWVGSGAVDVLFECYVRTTDMRYLHLPDSVTEAVLGAPIWVAK